MTILLHELRRGAKSFWVWSLSVGALLLVCLMLYPGLKEQAGQVSEMFSNMGGFSAAFGMNVLGFGTAMGFYGIECGACLALGGGMYAAFVGSGLIAKEETGHTAEFLYTHPISRTRVLVEKFAALKLQLIGFNVVCVLFSLGGFAWAGETPAWKAFFLYQLAQLWLQIEIGALCFAISAFAGRSAFGAGLGLMALLYFLSLWGNISDQVTWVKYITPFWYADASRVIADSTLDLPLMGLGLLYMAAAFVAALVCYNHRDIRA